MNHASTIISISTSYALFLVLLWISRRKNGLRLIGENGMTSNRLMLIILHIGGVIVFGFMPIATRSLPSITVYNKTGSIWPTCICIMLAIVSVCISWKLAENKQTKGSQASDTSIRFIIFYFLLRISFITVYEIWFRGYLLNALLVSFSIPFAILLNVILYAVLHVVNGKQETLACIPFGMLLCILCIWQSSSWPAILIHLALTFSYEIVALRKIKNKKLKYESISNWSVGLSR